MPRSPTRLLARRLTGAAILSVLCAVLALVPASPLLARDDTRAGGAERFGRGWPLRPGPGQGEARGTFQPGVRPWLPNTRVEPRSSVPGTPEPSAALLFGLGAVIAAAAMRQRRR